jgi:hypothetical protein
MATSHYRYLNTGDQPRLSSVLAEKLRALQPRAPASQWVATIRALDQKGVKQREIEDSKLLDWLAAQGNQSVTRDSILTRLTLLPTIKEIDLSEPKYRRYAVPGFDRYQETLYCLNSPRNNIEDRLDEIRYELDDLDFNPERLVKQPSLVFELDAERRELLGQIDSAPDFANHHFSGQVDPATGSTIKNLIAHARTSVRGDVYFIDEIQSDWAQRRRLGRGATPDGPFINNTDAWAGLVLRRVMQRAAEDPRMNGVSWINAGLRNGGGIGSNEDDGLNDFYLKTLPNLANKALKGTGVSVKAQDVALNSSVRHSLPFFPITDAVRQKLAAAQPLYSMDLLPPSQPSLAPDMSMDEMIRDAREMLGSTVAVRLVNRVIRAANGEEHEAAGRHLANLIEFSNRARSAARAFNHESFHYAISHLMSEHEASTIRSAFVDGSGLNTRVRQCMVAAGMAPEAVAQCVDAEETAAHAFSLWRQGQFHFDVRGAEYQGDTGLDRTIGRVFRKVEAAFSALARWTRRIVGDTPDQAHGRISEQLFEALREGTLQKRRELQEWDAASEPEHTEAELVTDTPRPCAPSPMG